MRKIILIYYLYNIFFICSVSGQTRVNLPYKCGTVQYHKNIYKENPEIKIKIESTSRKIREMANHFDFKFLQRENYFADSIYRIPVVVHVIYRNTNAPENISDAQIISQIEVLNNDFRKKFGTEGYNSDPVGADCMIEFFLATKDPNGNPTNGIVRINDTTSYFDFSSEKEAYLKNLSRWNTAKYLNIWVCRLDPAQFLLGYATYPGGSSSLDGAVINYQTFGKNSIKKPYNRGRTTTHEIGHYLNLLHTWGDGGCNVDDGFSDTPDCDGEYYAAYDDPLGYCATVYQCGNNRRMVENYLDYSDDTCMNIFTKEQANYMLATLKSYRTELYQSELATIDESKINVIESIIYPNIFSSELFIRIPEEIRNDFRNIEIFNTWGNRIFSGKNIHSLQDYIITNSGSLSSGFYFIRMNLRDKFISLPVVKIN